MNVLLLLLSLPGQLFAEIDVDINGYIQTDNRLRLDTNEFTWNENQFNLKFEGAPSDKYHYFSELRLKGLGFADVTQSSDLQKKEYVFRWDLELREAFLDLYQFGLENIDVRIGRQIIAWGTADKLNPTSNLCPDDLEDTFNFGEKLGVNASNATYWGDNFSITGVFVPIFTPAVLPAGDFARAFADSMDFPPGMILRTISDKIISPEKTLSESSQYALKISTMLFDNDVSLSYFSGRDDLPLADKVTIMPVDTQGTVDIETELMYPKMQIIGADFAGAIGSVGIWGEGALCVPDKVKMRTFVQISEGIQLQGEALALDDEPYFKYVLGGDYTFENGVYLNVQFLHGFFHERGKDELNDYFVFRFEKKFFNDELKVVPLGGAIGITDWDDVKNNYGFVTNPELTYYPTDNIELILGIFILEGKGNNMFSQIKDNDELYVKAKVSF